MPFKRDWVCEKCRFVVADVPTSIQEYKCPKCGKKMKKVITPPFIKFNGDGWTEQFYTRNGGK
jgi:predicted nucleic acid-binding Zn ribbon protein